MHTDDTQEPQDFPVAAAKLDNGSGWQELAAAAPDWTVSVSAHSPTGDYWDATVGSPEHQPQSTADVGRAVYSAALAVVTALGPEASLAFQRATLGLGDSR